MGALVIERGSDRRFYETFFEEAQQLAQTLDLILTSQASTAPNAERIPAADLFGEVSEAAEAAEWGGDRFLSQLKGVAGGQGRGRVD